MWAKVFTPALEPYNETALIEAAQRLRKEVLALAATRPADEMMEAFLGGKADIETFLISLNISENLL